LNKHNLDKMFDRIINKTQRTIKKIVGENIFIKFFYRNVSILSSKKFKIWWKHYKRNNKLDINLEMMLDDLIDNKNFKDYSPYWNYLAQNHIKLLNEKGIENFKQTIERLHYWGEGTTHSKILEPIQNDKITIEYDKEELLKKHKFCLEDESKEYNKSNLILLNYLVNNEYQKYLDKMEEPNFGNPIFFNYKNKKYSFALMNSILEIDILNRYIDFDKLNSILEIGAGSGRFCSSLLQTKKILSYTIVDIPPTLFVSQSNLSNIFKNKKIFNYRKFNNFKEIEKEFISSDIRFLLPEQLKLIPNKSFDLSIATDCLHEFNKSQVDKYFDEFNRLSNFFYFKCQNIQWAIFEKKERYDMNNYPIKNNWKKIIHEKCHIPNRYFQALYKIN
tara:strand:+ start:209 stop:1375 length:1167 start_codon:yes stop_codon:yes gene_type:complete